MQTLTWKRTLRTQSSERYLCQRDGGADAAAIDLHFLPTGQVVGTVVLLDEAGWTEDQIPHLLKSLDDDFLPGVDLGTGGISFTVVSGRVVANYEADGAA
jgi:hypothetical protein